MKVILCTPIEGYSIKIPMIPLGISFIAGTLEKEGYEIKIVDNYLEQPSCYLLHGFWIALKKYLGKRKLIMSTSSWMRHLAIKSGTYLVSKLKSLQKNKVV